MPAHMAMHMKPEKTMQSLRSPLVKLIRQVLSVLSGLPHVFFMTYRSVRICLQDQNPGYFHM